MDKMTAKESDIYGNMTRNLPGNSESDTPFTLIDSLRADYVRVFGGK